MEQEVKDAFAKVQDAIDELSVALMGNKKYNQRGWSDDLTDARTDITNLKRTTLLKFDIQDDEIKKLKDRDYKQTVIVGVFSAMGGALATFFGKIGFIKLISFFK